MSSVSRKDEISQLKNYYSQREADLISKHRNEVENLKKDHSVELEKNQTLAKEEIEQTKGRFADKFSEKDRQHQKDIENLKALYQKKLEDARKNS
ncbi:MAG: hypothetical protein BroJett041_23770 [Candidatus Jettenia caeni]|nr:MAG: hypothetical protein BroJett041_23770 [Candidatus Jettenia caeni]